MASGLPFPRKAIWMSGLRCAYLCEKFGLLATIQRSSRCLARQCLAHIGLGHQNCRAICDGLTPALKAARTAFIFPGVK
jgi:hypothetical protein